MFSESGSSPAFSGLFHVNDKKMVVMPPLSDLKAHTKEIVSQKRKQELFSLQEDGPPDQKLRKKTVDAGFKTMIKRAEAIDQVGGDSGEIVGPVTEPLAPPDIPGQIPLDKLKKKFKKPHKKKSVFKVTTWKLVWFKEKFSKEGKENC